MKRYLVLYEKQWMKGELLTDRMKRLVKAGRLEFVYERRSFKDAPKIKTKEGTKIDDNWIRSNVDDRGYHGVVVVLDGEQLDGRHGLHSKKLSKGNARYSVIQMEAKKGQYRVWDQKKSGDWYLKITKRRSKDSYKQLQYTFEHEIGHSLKYLSFQFDTLHLYVRFKNYDLWWNVNEKTML